METAKLPLSSSTARPLPKSYLSEEELEDLRREASMNLRPLMESDAAGKAGDEDTAWSWLALADLPAHSLMFLKKQRGAHFIREYGFPTEEAEARYGKNWLD